MLMVRFLGSAFFDYALLHVIVIIIMIVIVIIIMIVIIMITSLITRREWK